MENQFYQQGYQYHPQGRNENANNMPKVRNGGAWYVIILPALAIFLESFTVNKYMGAALWAVIILISPLFCYFDYKYLEKSGNFVGSLKKYVWIPILYVAFRSKTFNQGSGKVILYAIIIFYALVNNGFTQGLLYEDKDFMERVSLNYVANLEEYYESKTINMIGEKLTAFINEDEVDYSLETKGDLRYVTAKGTCKYGDEKSAKLEVVFLIDYDGFSFKEFCVDSVTLDGKELKDDERADFLDELFIADNENDEDNSEVDESDKNEKPDEGDNSDDEYVTA